MSNLENIYKLNRYLYMDSNQKYLNIKSIVLSMIVKKCFF